MVYRLLAIACLLLNAILPQGVVCCLQSAESCSTAASICGKCCDDELCGSDCSSACHDESCCGEVSPVCCSGEQPVDVCFASSLMGLCEGCCLCPTHTGEPPAPSGDSSTTLINAMWAGAGNRCFPLCAAEASARMRFGWTSAREVSADAGARCAKLCRWTV